MAETGIPAGGVLVAGPAAVGAFHHILGIPPGLRDDGIYRVTKVEWSDGSLQIHVAGRDFQRAVLRVTEQPGAPVMISADGPPQALHPSVEKLLRSARRRLDRTPLQGLLDLIRRDPETVEQSSPPEPAGAVREGVNLVPMPYVHEWTGKPGELGQWGLFFDDLVFVYTGWTRVNFVVPTTHVTHGNHECLCVTPKIRTRSARIFNYPRRASWPTSDLIRSRLGMGPQYLDKPFRRLSTDLGELDVVLGSDAKLGRALSLAAEGEGDRIVGFHKTCLAKVMGDDVERPLEAVRRTPGVHCLTRCMGFTHDQNLYAEELEFGDEESKVIADLLPPGARREPGEGDVGGPRFDLVGFPDGPDTAELASLLEDCGATLGVLLLPDIDVPVFRRTPRPDCQVRLPNTWFARLYDEVFDRLADRVIAPEAPFGLRASEAWVREVATGLGLDDAKAGEALRRARLAIRPRWDALTEIARNLRVGFVVDSRVLPRLADPKRSFGLCMPAMLEEMGFGIDLLCYAPSGDVSYARALQSDRVRLHEFRDEAGMHSLLRTGEFQAVYSDRNFEHRLAANGKAQFGFGDFEMGLQGALRSLERLVRACSIPFYSRHARYLRRGAP